MEIGQGAGGLNTLPFIEKLIYLKPFSPVTKKILASKTLGPVVKKALDREIVIYIFFGVVTTVVAFVFFRACLLLGLSNSASTAVSAVIAIAFAFIVNKHYVFLSRDWSFQKTINELWQFSGGRLIASAGQTGLMYLMVDKLHLNGNVWWLITTILVMVVNYIISKLIF